ncbi:hypothetical protein V8F20_012845 [Naviculisporaceae sp. PSN 640]
MLVTQISALLAAIPLATALSVRGGPGGWHGGRGGGWGGPHGDGDHDYDNDGPFEFRIVTYDVATETTIEYLEVSPEVDGVYGLVQTPEQDEAGIFELTDEGYLVYNSPEGVSPTVGPIYAAFDPEALTVDGPWPLVFASQETIDGPPELTEWLWTADYDDHTLTLTRQGTDTPYYFLLCPVDGDAEYYLAVGVDGAEVPEGCVATHLDIQAVDEDYHDW